MVKTFNLGAALALPSLVFVLSATPATAVAAEKEAAPPGDKALSSTLDFNLAPDSKWIEKFTLTPRVLQGKDDGNISLGVGYDFASRPIAKDLTPEVPLNSPPPTIRPMAAFEMTAKGLYAAKAEANNENLINAAASGVYELTYKSLYSKSAFSAAYERQQGNDTKASRWELSQGFGAWLRDLHDIEILGKAAFARVNPQNDPARKAALGADPGSYRRWEVQALVIVPVQLGALQKIELGHRHFYEPGAPAAIRAAKLDTFKLSTVYFQIDGGFFVAFSKGGLPADRKDSQVVQLGWSTNIGK